MPAIEPPRKWRMVREMPRSAPASNISPPAKLMWTWQELPAQSVCGLAMNVATSPCCAASSFTAALKRNASSAASRAGR
jgi:hypothetical protein